MAASVRFQNFMKTFGPGIMFAGTCIGGSHLVQSTKAGAFYGFALLGIVLLANLFKYPFFEFASRYTNATGDSILEGYSRMGKWILVAYLLVTIVSMFIITAAIGALTGGLANNLFGSIPGITAIKGHWWALIIFCVVLGLLALGKFGLLDKTLKGVGLVLVLAVCIAFFSVVFSKSPPPQTDSMFSVLGDSKGLIFAIALMGWMPIAVDMSTWASLWTQERIKQTGYHPTLKETLLDFNIGYFITIVLAIFFLTIGAYTLYNHPSPDYSPSAIDAMKGLAYSKTLVKIFTDAVGPWSYYVILVAAFATMLGTSITLIDGYCRSVERSFSLLFNRSSESGVEFSRTQYLLWVVVLVIGSYVIIVFYVQKIGVILNLATVISFIIAPFAALLNFRIMFNKEVLAQFRPPMWLKILAIAGIIFLSVFSFLFLKAKFAATKPEEKESAIYSSTFRQ